MTDDIKIFSNPEFGEVRVLMLDGEPWAVGKDVAAALGYTDTKHAVLDHVDEDDRINSKTLGQYDPQIEFRTGGQNVTEFETRGQNIPEFGQRGTWLINESGIYSLIMSSKLPGAKKFKKWVTGEVLPSIRKTGSYGTPKPLSPAELVAMQANLLVEHERKLAALESDAAQTRKIVTGVAKALSAPLVQDEGWQERTNAAINELVEAGGLNHQNYRRQLYAMLERAAKVDLTARQTRRRNRMKAEGKTVRQQNEITKLHIIAEDPKLRAIFDAIIREEQAKRLIGSAEE